MSQQKINVLPPAIFNLLAAGEVVENPAAIVKECVENSLDAGATRIEIEIERGGLDLIRITDNGSGVEDSEIEKVFLPHATSKIEKARDLECIGTLGFRGEALSSIAAVSKVEFSTMSHKANLGISLVLDAGKITSKKPQAMNPGTTITISNLFYNTPARKKFLQSPNAEKNNVTTAVGRLILANPGVSFKYTIDGDKIYDYHGKSLLDAIQAIYSDAIGGNLLSLNAKAPKFSLSGHISKPNFTKRNRTYQTLIVNGRAVEGGIVGTAVNAAFSNYMTVGNFPFFVLNLTIDTHEVDVNVHPRKAQIKFSNEQEIFDFVRHTVMDTMDKYMHKQHTNNFKPQQDTELLQRIKYFSSTPVKSEVKSAPHIMNKYDLEERKTKDMKPIISSFLPLSSSFNFHILGTIFDTYILVSHKEKFLIIDQHAAHERLLYDELKGQIDSDTIAVQRLLEPAVMVLNAQEMTKMEATVPYLNDIGFECEPFGTNCFRITAVPVLISDHGIETVIENILHDVKSTPPAKLSTVMQDKIISQCCKNSIKAGERLNNEQIKYFLEQIGDTKSMHCPHGRPIIISYSKDQIEKMFARK